MDLTERTAVYLREQLPKAKITRHGDMLKALDDGYVILIGHAQMAVAGEAHLSELVRESILRAQVRGRLTA